jgi:fluoroacetyl-CoA thioesterase
VGLDVGLRSSGTREVTSADTAAALGSGDLPVLATPRLLAWFEAATVAAIADRLSEQQTSVGTRVSMEHSRPTLVGRTVRVSAEVSHVDGRLVRFEVVAEDEDGALVGHGQVTRVIVDRDRFLGRASS